MSVIGLVININGVSIADAEDSEYVEVASDLRDVVVDAVMSGDDDLPEGVKAIRRYGVADLVEVYDAAKALLDAADLPSDAPNGVRYGDAFSNAFILLDNAVTVAGR